MINLWLEFWVFELVQFFGLLVIFISFWGGLPYDNWWIRFADFPRLQILFVGSLSWLLMWSFVAYWQLFQQIMVLLLLFVLLYQFAMVLPYTQFWRKQVKTAKNDANISQKSRIKIIVSNVLTPNRQTDKLIKLVDDYQPDVLLTLESDLKWQNALNKIESDFAYSIKIPLDNLYGMHLYSKYELIDAKIKYLVVDDIPSIETQVKLPNGKKVWLYCLHPMPPSPMEVNKSTTRDAELLMIGRKIRQHAQTAIVAGDLNDVAWSRTTRQFRRVSGLLDPRIGRKFINTFHAQLPLFRWALDHVFHSHDFTLVDIKKLEPIGSDHFPIFTELQYEPDAIKHQKRFVSTLALSELKNSRHRVLVGLLEGKRVSLLRRQKQLNKILYKNNKMSKKSVVVSNAKGDM